MRGKSKSKTYSSKTQKKWKPTPGNLRDLGVQVSYEIEVLSRYYEVKALSLKEARVKACSMFCSDTDNPDRGRYPIAFLRSQVSTHTKYLGLETTKTRKPYKTRKTMSTPPKTRLCRQCNKELVNLDHPSSIYCKDCWGYHHHQISRDNPQSYLSKGGYKSILVPGGRYRPEHKVVMEKILSRKLRKGEAVHHINADRADNRPENLELWIRTHPSGARARDLICPHCGKSYLEVSTGNQI